MRRETRVVTVVGQEGLSWTSIFSIMGSSKQDMFFNRTSFHSMTMPWGIHVDPHDSSLRDAYGVSFHFDSATYWDSRYSAHLSYLPFQTHLGLCDYSMEPAFIRKRNERERQRVRCVNEGYARLRQHLPQDMAEKRLSKVETLRAAIGYIKRLQGLLDLESLRSPLEDNGSYVDDISHGTSHSNKDIPVCDSPGRTLHREPLNDTT